MKQGAAAELHDLQRLAQAGALDWIDVQFAGELCRLAGDAASQALARFAALVSQATLSRQHVCLHLTADGVASLQELILDDLSDDEQSGRQDLIEVVRGWKLVNNVEERLLCSGLVAASAQARQRPLPLVLEDGRLYLQRYWVYEERLAQALRERMKPTQAEPSPLLRRIVEVSPRFSLLPGPHRQPLAVASALTSHFALITGGPGTGKTTVIAAILGLLLESNPNLRIALCAPTGKAQARLGEAVQSESNELRITEKTRALLRALQPSTIHRLLGVVPDSPRFRHNRRNLLAADVVVVDEASMIDQPLLAKLLEAVPAEARVILLGDRHQLASVESGAVLADLCQTGSGFSASFLAQCEAALGASLPEQPATISTTADAWQSVVELTHTFRFRDDGGIGRLCQTINAGDANRAWSVLHQTDTDPSLGVVRHAALPPLAMRAADQQRRILQKTLGDFLETWGSDGERLLDLPQQVALPEAFALLRRFQVLCATRSGPCGVELINRIVCDLLGIREDCAHGLPVMITRNDPGLGLYNGDIGLCWQADDGDVRVFFEGANEFRAFSPRQLPQYEPAFAMTVHKSQGSGFDKVLLILPPRHSPLISRELLYTAVTRARSDVTLWAGEDVFRAAIGSVCRRPSGLATKLAPKTCGTSTEREVVVDAL